MPGLRQTSEAAAWSPAASVQLGSLGRRRTGICPGGVWALQLGTCIIMRKIITKLGKWSNSYGNFTGNRDGMSGSVFTFPGSWITVLCHCDGTHVPSLIWHYPNSEAMILEGTTVRRSQGCSLSEVNWHLHKGDHRELPPHFRTCGHSGRHPRAARKMTLNRPHAWQVLDLGTVGNPSQSLQSHLVFCILP